MIVQGFNAEMKCQQEFGWLLAIWIFLSGTGCSLYLFVKVLGLPISFAVLALACIVVGGVVLLFELGSPTRAWRALSQVGTSWLSRGVLFVSVFLASSLLSIAPEFTSSLPWERGGFTAIALGWIASLCALMIVFYPGFFLAKNRSIPFWSSPLLPVILFAYAALGATGWMLLGSSGLTGELQFIHLLAGLLIVVNLILVAVYLAVMYRAGGPARESVRLLDSEPLNWIFRVGVVLVGMILPLLTLIWLPSGGMLAGIGILVGCFLFRYCVLRMGVFVPPALIQDDIDFSMLRRTSADLKHEFAGAGAQQVHGRGSMPQTPSAVAIRVRFMGDLPSITGRREQFVSMLEGSTVGDLLASLSKTHGNGFKDRVFNGPGRLDHTMLIFVDGNNIKDCGGLAAPLGKSEVEVIMLPIFGGG